ncbi:MAG: DNA mismatch repair protein MutS [Sphaerochaetaceae bacterium]|nr:DNA mismatch repair protein MutS [Sphaerochaetaceae bacterium]
MSEANITPMMKQYLEIKERYKDEVLFFRLGDFYEMFMDDAVEVSRLLNLTLTKRNGHPMCGIPHHAAKTYLKRLLDEGKKIAICEQTRLPDSPSAIAQREVVQVITPGTVVEDEFLEEISSSFILALSRVADEYSIAYCDISSLSFYTIEAAWDNTFHELRTLLEQIHVREVVIDDALIDEYPTLRSILDERELVVNRLPTWHFTVSKGYESLIQAFSLVNLHAFGLSKEHACLAAAGALLYYIGHTSKQPVFHLQNLTHIKPNDYLMIDESSRRNLELVRNLQDGSSRMTLFSAIHDTLSSGGARLLQRWIQMPLTSQEHIEARTDRVSWFLEHMEEHHRIRGLLRETRDIMRIISRVSLNRHTPLDMLTLSDTLHLFFEITGVYTQHYLSHFSTIIDEQERQVLTHLSQDLTRAVSDRVTSIYTPHTIIREGYDAELDEKRRLMNNGSQEISRYVDEVKAIHGIPQIKLSYNKIIGHYIEVTKTHADKIPDTFFRKQTLVNSERYTSEELIRLESDINAAHRQCAEIEMELFHKLVQQVIQAIPLLYRMGQLLSEIDCIQSFAYTAQRRSYVKAVLTDTRQFSIEEGRHPVVEQYLPEGAFIANPLQLDETRGHLALITGPNMAGKSTFLRQNALIVILAHIGSFVPASRAQIPLSDAVFCRVGASDNLARGESTFLIEMQEAAYILRHASPRSLVIMDEIGRGTSTQDGLSIAYAVMRRLEQSRIPTLFATHYHELTMMDTSGIQLLTLAVRENKRTITFLRRIVEGSADSSYGLHVASLAGMPKDVLSSALHFQREHYASYALQVSSPQLDLFTGIGEHTQEHPVLEKLRSYPLETVSPIDAMNFIAELKRELDDQ